MKQLRDLMLNLAGLAIGVYVFAQCLINPAAAATYAAWTAIITFSIGVIISLVSKE